MGPYAKFDMLDASNFKPVKRLSFALIEGLSCPLEGSVRIPEVSNRWFVAIVIIVIVGTFSSHHWRDMSTNHFCGSPLYFTPSWANVSCRTAREKQGRGLPEEQGPASVCVCALFVCVCVFVRWCVCVCTCVFVFEGTRFV